MSDQAQLKRFLRIGEVTRLTGMPPSTVYQKMAEGTFPKNIPLGPRMRAWLEDDLIQWQQARLAERGAA